MCENCSKYQYANRAVCSYVHDFRNRPGCVLIRTNTVYIISISGALTSTSRNTDRSNKIPRPL